MYKTHVPMISKQFRSDPGLTLVRTVDFVLATIQQRFHTVEAILKEWEAWDPYGGEPRPGTLWGMKENGFKYTREHLDRLTSLVQFGMSRGDEVDTIDTLLEVPGLGIAKAGFVVQLLGGEVGCLDTHNLRIYDIDPDTFSYVPQRAKDRLALIGSYVDLCRRLGGSADLWDRWCYFIAQEQRAHFENAFEVSATHVDCILSQ